MTAAAKYTTARPSPNSVVTYSVVRPGTVIRSKTSWTNRLWLAWKSTAVHTLPDLSRSHARTNEIATNEIAKTVRPNQMGARLWYPAKMMAGTWNSTHIDPLSSPTRRKGTAFA